MPPTIVVVPGAWHTADCASPFIAELRAAGYPTYTVQLPTVGTTKPLADDEAFLRAEFTKLLVDEGKDLIVILHSFAGYSGSTAVRGFGPSSDRGEGKLGGGGSVLGLVFLSALVPQEGRSLEEVAGGKLPDYQDLKEEQGLTIVRDPKSIFYGDVPDELAAKAIESVQVQSLRSFRDPAGPRGFTDAAFDGRRAYIVTTDDPCHPVAWQEGGMAASGVEWEKVTMPTSHSPFLSRPKELANHVLRWAEKWQQPGQLRKE